ncbi:MAG: thioredoxin domain-containing protein [Pseudomonadota bacterium]
MKKTSMIALATVLIAGSLLTACNKVTKVTDNSSTSTSASTGFSDQQKEQIGKIASDYIVKHPEVLIQASQALQAKQQQMQQQAFTKNAIANADALRDTDRSTTGGKILSPVIGKSTAKVTVVEFYDSNCHFCHVSYPLVDKLLKTDTDVRYVAKQFPIFAQRWQSSQLAAQLGVLAYQQGGADMYAKFEAGIFNPKADLEEGKLTTDDVNKIAKAAGVDISKLPSQLKAINAKIDSDKNLAMKIGFQATPSFVILPTTGTANASNVTVIYGYPGSMSRLQAAVNKAKNN